ncbi:hypothetical protein [Streptomyces radiopugnans]|uniref:hypothetical protein n=1 Tax=Streptomyces radiopugnans TaxID=403935 RepID=UPI003F1C2EEC
MARIERIEVEVLTGDEPGAGTDALVYLGIAGREFLLDRRNEDDFRRGGRDFFTLGRGGNISPRELNDPRTPQLRTDDLDRHPVYVRLDAWREGDAWLLDNVWVSVESEGSDDFGVRYGRPALDGSGEERAVWLGTRAGTVLHLEELRPVER